MADKSIEVRQFDGELSSAHTSKSILCALLGPAESQDGLWNATDLLAILLHQLTTPLAEELDQIAQASGRSCAEAAEIFATCGCRAFGDILFQRPPCGPALHLLKDYAKAALQKTGDLPTDVARVLYIACIQHGRKACIPGMSSLGAVNLEREIRRCLTFGWLPEEIRSILGNA